MTRSMQRKQPIINVSPGIIAVNVVTSTEPHNHDLPEGGGEINHGKAECCVYDALWVTTANKDFAS